MVKLYSVWSKLYLRISWQVLILVVCGYIFSACDDDSTPMIVDNSLGPKVIFDLSSVSDEDDHKTNSLPFPLPNDAIFSTEWELKEDLIHVPKWKTLLEQASLLGGSSLRPQITIPFSQPIDIDDFVLRHSNKSVRDDAIFLVCISGKCNGDIVGLEMGVSKESYGVFSELDTLAEYANLPTKERLLPFSSPLPLRLQQDKFILTQAVQQGLISSTQDEKTLSLSESNQETDQIYPFQYAAPSLGEEATIVVLRPTRTLESEAVYAVTLTTALKSSKGRVSKQIMGQVPDDLLATNSETIKILENIGLREEDIALSWQFTTGQPNAVHKTLRQAITSSTQGAEGLQGIVSSFPPKLTTAHQWANQESITACEGRDGQDCRVDTEQYALLTKGARGLALAWANTKKDLSIDEKTALYQSYHAVKGLFSGQLSGWMVSKWSGSSQGEELSVSDQTRPFWCIIPESGSWVDQELNTRSRQAPFPVILWSSNSNYERLDLLLWAGFFARAGYASCAIETQQKSHDQSVYEQLALNLSIEWRDLGWSPALALANLKDHEQVAIPKVPMDFYSVNRPLNRSLIQQQLVWWLSHDSDVGSTRLDILKTLLSIPLMQTDINRGEVEEIEEHPFGSLVYAGEGEGATAATLSAMMDEAAQGLITVDLVSDLAVQQSIGLGRGGADVLINRQFGPWLIWDKTDNEGGTDSSEIGWQWQGDSMGKTPIQVIRDKQAHLEMMITNVSEVEADQVTSSSMIWQDSTLDLSALSGKWLALFNHRTQARGKKSKVELNTEQLFALSVASKRGDLLSLEVFESEEDEVPTMTSSQLLIAPYTGSGSAPFSEKASQQLYLTQWELALDDPLESVKQLKSSSSLREDEVRTLMIAHPRALAVPLRSSLVFARELGLFNESTRADLYDLTAYQFMLLSQAFDPRRAWGEPWMDWDDLDLLESRSPSFTRNVQISLDRSSFLGGYHALRMPWRDSNSTGLGLAEDQSEPLATFTLNLLGRFLSSQSRGASVEELDDVCLKYLVPSVRSCNFISVTDQDTE